MLLLLLYIIIITEAAFVFAVSSISRVLRARFGKKDDEDECDKKEEDGEKKTKHSIDGILGDKGRPVEIAQPRPCGQLLV